VASVADWGGFATAQVGAAAALSGLIFVGISVNLQRILSTPGLPRRAGEALVALLALLLASGLLLIPGQTTALVGWELLLVGVVAWLGVVGIHLRSRGTWEQSHPQSFAFRIALGQTATLPFILAGLGVLLRGDGALGWFALGTIGVYLFAFTNAWVMLIEIDR
jgi:hypothetical protein